MSKLTLASISATSFLFPAATEFRLVETQLPVVRAWTVTILRGVLGDSGGWGSQAAVVCGSTNKCVIVLVLDVPGHQLGGGEIILRVCLRGVELVGEHRESGSTKSGWRVHSSWELLEVIG